MKQTDTFIDNTQLSSYKDCPRRFFLRHRLNWRSEGTATPLVFGLAWGSAMDAVWQAATSAWNTRSNLAEIGFTAFKETWSEQGLPLDLDLEDTERFSPRTPSIAREMLHSYVEERYSFLSRVEDLQIEQPFAVPLPGLLNTWYIGKFDKKFTLDGTPIIGEHKTTALYRKDGGFPREYIEGWNSSPQVKGYEYGGQLFYPGLTNVLVDCALVHKSARAFRLVNVSHSYPLLAEWINDTSEWIRRIQRDDMDFKFGQGHLNPGVFPKNEEQCYTKYGSCQFLDICRTVSDPTRELNGPPPGFVEEKWEPFDILGLAKILGEQK